MFRTRQIIQICHETMKNRPRFPVFPPKVTAVGATSIFLFWKKSMRSPDWNRNNHHHWSIKLYSKHVGYWRCRSWTRFVSALYRSPSFFPGPLTLNPSFIQISILGSRRDSCEIGWRAPAARRVILSPRCQSLYSIANLLLLYWAGLCSSSWLSSDAMTTCSQHGCRLTRLVGTSKLLPRYVFKNIRHDPGNVFGSCISCLYKRRNRRSASPKLLVSHGLTEVVLKKDKGIPSQQTALILEFLASHNAELNGT